MRGRGPLSERADGCCGARQRLLKHSAQPCLLPNFVTLWRARDTHGFATIAGQLYVMGGWDGTGKSVHDRRSAGGSMREGEWGRQEFKESEASMFISGNGEHM